MLRATVKFLTDCCGVQIYAGYFLLKDIGRTHGGLL